LAQLHDVAPPSPPSVTYLTNPAGLTDPRLEDPAEMGTADVYAQLTLVADDIAATLAESPGKDGRNATIQALRRKLTFVQDLMERCKSRRDQC
jgi:hypothetical protein